MPDNINITALHFTVTSVLLFRIKINKIQNQTNKYICVQRIYITLEVADFEVLTWADITQIEQEIFLSHSLSLDTKLLVTIYCVYFFSLRVCSWLPQQIFSLSILLLLFLRYFNHSILVQKYKILQISIICYGHIIFIFLWLKLSWYDMRPEEWGNLHLYYLRIL